MWAVGLWARHFRGLMDSNQLEMVYRHRIWWRLLDMRTERCPAPISLSTS